MLRVALFTERGGVEDTLGTTNYLLSLLCMNNCFVFEGRVVELAMEILRSLQYRHSMGPYLEGINAKYLQLTIAQARQPRMYVITICNVSSEYSIFLRALFVKCSHAAGLHVLVCLQFNRI